MADAGASSNPDSQQFGRIVLGGRTAHLESSVGTLKLHPGGVGWKSRETGNVIAYSKGDIRGLEWIKIPHAYQLKLKAKGGFTYRFNGLKSQARRGAPRPARLVCVCVCVCARRHACRRVWARGRRIRA